MRASDRVACEIHLPDHDASVSARTGDINFPLTSKANMVAAKLRETAEDILRLEADRLSIDSEILALRRLMLKVVC